MRTNLVASTLPYISASCHLTRTSTAARGITGEPRPSQLADAAVSTPLADPLSAHDTTAAQTVPLRPARAANAASTWDEDYEEKQ